jgi:uncharacterized protein YfaS (alpha-2-macroglobulin family)
MKKLATLILLFSSLMQAQQSYPTYPELWKEVEKFENDDLPKSANQSVEKIYQLAKKEQNSPQLVKALLFQSKYAMDLEEDAELLIVQRLEKELSESTFPIQNILESILANLYWQYFQENRWQFYNRTETSEKINPDDFRTWDLKTIFKEIQVHYEKSLAQEKLLQSTDLSPFEAILITSSHHKIYQPTLYDFLAHQALDFYQTDENSISQPANKFEMTDQLLLADYDTFSSLTLATQDTLSLTFQALQLYQKLTLFHRIRLDKSPLILLDIDRLHFVKEQGVIPDKENLFFETIKISQSRNISHQAGTLYDFEMASVYKNQGNTYSYPSHLGEQWKLKSAMEVCGNAIKRFPESWGAQKCLNLQNEILVPKLSLQTESFLPENKAARIKVEYTNLEHLEFQVCKVNAKTQKDIQNIYDDSIVLAKLKDFKVVQNWKQDLKTIDDYQNHSTETLFPALPQGFYVIVAKIPDTETFAYAFVQVTDWVLTEIETHTEQRLQLVNRNTGNPIKGASIHLKSLRESRYDKPFDKSFTSDANGFIYLPNNTYYYNLEATVKLGKKTAVFSPFSINEIYRGQDSKEAYHQVEVFTDRSIYRPGQKVYFKGIVFKNEYFGKKIVSKVTSDLKLEALLFDVNYQEIGKLQVTTNAYGSVAGEFILPETGLTGMFHLRIKNSNSKIYGETSVSVEEYKRPKFEVVFNPVKETFKVNETVTVKGNALAYAGSNITDAKVVYAVKRLVQYPRWCYWRMPYFHSEPQEITHGETQTDANGVFEIAFTALPDWSVDAKNQPIFRYEITADVTDINGETHTAVSVVQVGYHSMTAGIFTATQWDKSADSHSINLTTQNLNGEKVPSQGVLKIYKLKAPKQVKRERPWSAPEYSIWSESEFNKLFPNDFFEGGSDVNQWKTEEKVFEKTYDAPEGTADLKLQKDYKNWESGSYQAVLETKDAQGNDIVDKVIFSVWHPQDQKVADQRLFSVYTDKSSYRPGEKVVLKVGSASPDAMIYVYVEKDKKIIQTLPIVIHDQQKSLEIPVLETDLGGFSIMVTQVNLNAFSTQVLSVNVIEEKPVLSIETLTFRDKMQPGSEQTWSFKLKGLQKDQKAAELLASMYDASLDQFTPHQWQLPYIQQNTYWSNLNASAYNSFGQKGFTVRQLPEWDYIDTHQFEWTQWNWFGFNFTNDLKGYVYAMKASSPRRLEENVMAEVAAPAEELDEMKDSVGNGNIDVVGLSKEEIKTKPKTDFSDVKIRTNFNETAFFYPQLYTDAEGNITFTFTSPEALTRWKMQLLGHTIDMQTVYQSATSVTQKDLMVQPNAPRFLREGDAIIFSTKLSNISDQKLDGVAMLELTDALTGAHIDGLLSNVETQKTFSIDAKGNAVVSWNFVVPQGLQAVQYKVVAKAGDFSDGEQNVLPVLTNRMLVTETLPMWVNSGETRTFTLDKLKNNTSTTLQNHKLTLEVTSHPVWYAIQALPYLMEYPYECSEQTFSRYYANALATKIVSDNPKIKAVFDQWENSDALLSNLEKNEELKSLLIAETPWLRDAQSETEQKKRIALLFDLKKMSKELEQSAKKLQDMQFSDGGFPWFKGSRYPDRYITQHIAAGFGHLEKLGVFPIRTKEMLTYDEGKKTHEMLIKAMGYLDARIIEDYDYIQNEAKKILQRPKDVKQGQKEADAYLKSNHLGAMQLHYLYTRSFYPEIAVNERLKKVLDYYQGQAVSYWKEYGLYQKGLIALVLNRSGKSDVAKTIVKSLDENSITHAELGMYWKENKGSWYWYQAPIETQALMIETFAEVKPVQSQLDQLKVWLLKNKQTNRWETTKSTTEAVFALLAYGTDWTISEQPVAVKVGGKEVTPTATEAGSGYFKTSWNPKDIKPEQATVSLTKTDKGIAWGGLYWQYFENLDKITFAVTPLQLSKKLFLKQNTDTGEKLFEIKDGTEVKVGDLVRVRIELKVDRDMEFVHMKDMRASGFEPVNVLSEYKYQDSLGYYESTKDAATNFFFSYLGKGVYVFEYDLRANNAGDFSNGITTIQCMYAPEFTSHSEGVRVVIKP